jgi:hypothetical protein
MLREKWLVVLAAFVALTESAALGQQKSTAARDLTKSTVIEKQPRTSWRGIQLVWPQRISPKPSESRSRPARSWLTTPQA